MLKSRVPHSMIIGLNRRKTEIEIDEMGILIFSVSMG